MRYILGSRSPRRRELLAEIVSAESIDVLPPRSAIEEEFANLSDRSTIEARLLSIARTKWDDVYSQCVEAGKISGEGHRAASVMIAADTIVVVADREGKPLVLGKPPVDSDWQATVREWFQNYYAGQTHQVLTGCIVGSSPKNMISRIVTTEVTFRADVETLLEWYLETGEPIDKAGGYAIQGRGHLFVTRVEGSYSNVVGLPLEELMSMLQELSGVR